MASKTYKVRALVLRKTKLWEKDLIVTMLDESGMLLQGVAKGARKPGGSLAARLELFSLVDVLMAQGKSLDVVCEARLVDPAPKAAEIERASSSAPLAELLCLVAQPDLAQPRLFDLSRAAFARIASPGPCNAALLCAASLWKVMAQSGFRPSLRQCAICGKPAGGGEDARVPFSLGDGGVVCASCPRPADAIVADANVVRWCDALLAARFDEIDSFECDLDTTFAILHFARAWIRAHTGRDLKSLDFLFTSGLFL